MEKFNFPNDFRQREMRSITVQRTQKCQRKIFSNKDANIGNFHCSSEM